MLTPKQIEETEGALPSHTPEPWAIFDAADRFPGIEAPDAGFSIVLWGNEDEDAGVRGESEEHALANAARIVSCVNACAGLNPEAVPEMVKALEEIAKNPSLTSGGRMRIAAAALAKAKGGQP
jgi:hypothetical protein